MPQAISIRELQSIFLEMMNQFHKFCVEHSLTYYMVGGTLLGAVREKGFIPWDDDVDFAMPRPDYERFIREYSGKMRLMSMHTDKNYAFPYIKLFNAETPVVHVTDAKYAICAKVFVKIDIYPIDGVGCSREKAAQLLKKVSRKKQFLYLNLTQYKSKNPIKDIGLRLVRLIPSRWLLRNIDRTMRSQGKKPSSLYTRWREGTAVTNLFDKEVFGEPVLLAFEGHSYYAPNNYDEYLLRVYGDYMVERRENTGMRHDIKHNEVTAEFAHKLKCEQSVNGGGGGNSLK